MAESRKHSGPIMGAAAGFDDNAARGPIRKERHEMRTFERLAVNRASLGIDVVNLENPLGQIDGNGRGFHLVLLAAVVPNQQCRTLRLAEPPRATAKAGGDHSI